MALSRANCARRVPSRNQRRTSTACLKQPSARVPARVPRRWRSACNRPETNSTVSSRTLNVAVYVTLILTRNPYEVDLWTDQPSYRGSASSRCTPTTSACRTASARRQLPNVTTALHGMAQCVRPHVARLPSASPSCCDSTAVQVFHLHSQTRRRMAHVELQPQPRFGHPRPIDPPVAGPP